MHQERGETAKGEWGKQGTVWWWGQGWKRSPEKEASEQWEARMQLSTQKWVTQDTQEVW